jgi:hypothetical protein
MATINYKDPVSGQWVEIPTGGTDITVDSSLSSTSENPVQNKVINSALNGKQATITSSNKLSASLVSGLSTVATSGSYNDLSDKPTAPVLSGDNTFTGSNVFKQSVAVNDNLKVYAAYDSVSEGAPWSIYTYFGVLAYCSKTNSTGYTLTYPSVAGTFSLQATTFNITVSSQPSAGSSSIINVPSEIIARANAEPDAAVICMRKSTSDTNPVYLMYGGRYNSTGFIYSGIKDGIYYSLSWITSTTVAQGMYAATALVSPAASQTTAGVAKIWVDSDNYLCIDTQ